MGLNTNIIVILMLSANLFALDFVGMNKSLKIVESNLIYSELKRNGDNIYIQSSYRKENKYGVSFLLFEKKRWMMLNSEEFVYLYEDNNKVKFYGAAKGKNHIDKFITPNLVSASSSLTEGNRVYSSNNLLYVNSDRPWVEGVDGPGIGQIINVKNEPFDSILISNGYVSYDYPCLYLRNNRVKEIKIVDNENEAEYTFLLEDTPNPQILSFEDKYMSDINIVILSVYKGSHYDDTCLNFIEVGI